MLQCNARYPLELHVVHAKVGEADYLDTPRGLSVTGFFFELDGVRGEGGTVERVLIIFLFQDNTNSALTPLTDALAQIIESDSSLDFTTVPFQVSLALS